jgi:ParB/RepB/Spo0J family partition protein
MIQKIVSIKKINLKDERFRININCKNLSFLKASIKKYGLINYPVLTEREKGLIIVSGWRRVLACIELDMEKIPIYLLLEDDDLKVLLFRIYEDLASRELNFLEKAEIISKLKSFGMRKEEIIEKYLPLLNINPSFYDFNIYLSLSNLDKSVKEAILNESLSFQSARAVTLFSKSDQKRLLPFLIPLSSNNQKELLVNIYEILKRDNISLKTLLTKQDIKKIIESEEFSALEKAKKIREIIKDMRYPLLSNWEVAYKDWIRELKLPSSIKIIHDKFFEKEGLNLSIKFRNPEELENNLKKMLKICKKEGFRNYFKDNHE